MPFQFELTSILFGVIIGYFLFSLNGFIQALRQKKQAQEELKKVEAKILDAKGKLEIKKRELEAEIKKEIGR
ncbi:hypothetical protein A2276_05660 [candidate division WOR-1 bacterium RIFOXYA12_FULL_43_27]|uniref:Uncharacterized protein n=1 Tax=candidate division WOR-1 bacterium RIFOXYC2_FULL_46_14 TaxID=1802587 RepID=A0A1F4U3M8_UNCSA|nr:MAG: hypothetical protein A2276_05660 [candidate division WOR-1 bacterium RIFOXYA12_FULL_43_27]OGC20152.1 MAG: hypothetical protein A2292_03665 [candidate division WOR-1 bacterium RIFOXYB2_FULL_46_45]OGC32111.1 MAG: hypothetical protein A2232_07785 [candidate division WOR-1 bacterium RIFOXYA2_FULL_46_56]OGC39512.1 MAG: hypothetical protein A2438_08145 [candidate division WOR-1 bacterium RIFOXYC2_FULL_46_14]